MAFTRALVVVFSVAAACEVRAEEVVLEPSKDNTIFEDTDDLSNGQGIYLFSAATAAKNAELVRRALLAFDVANNVPAAATITQAQLSMTVSKVPNRQVTNDFELLRVLQDWGEGSSDASGNEGKGAGATDGDATWSHSMFADTAWEAPGGDFVETASASASIGGTGKYTWESTEQLVLDVQGWLDDPSSNFGWIVIGDEARGRTAKRFGSVQGSARSRPMLTIEYELAALLGDFNGDGELTSADVNLLCGAIREQSGDAAFDLNGDQVVSIDDQVFWVTEVKGTLLGDADLDGTVGFPDFLALSARFSQEGGWEHGDSDCSGDVVFADFITLSANFNQSAAATAASVPEPSCICLLLYAVFSYIAVRRRRIHTCDTRL